MRRGLLAVVLLRTQPTLRRACIALAVSIPHLSMSATLAQALAADFQQRFGYAPLLVRAPGRVNLIGEHTDYNGGFVLPAAVDKEAVFAVGLNKSDQIRLVAHDLGETLDLANAAEISPSDTHWANYLLGVAAQFQQRGVAVPGFDCVFAGTVPLGAGMSSSAAIECGLAFALNKLLNAGFETMELARIAQFAEHTYAGVQCGIMDQFASLFGRDGQVVRLDCRSLEYEYFPFDTQAARIVLCNSGVKHSLASSEYNTRRQECERGVSILQQHYEGISSLRDATMEHLEAHRSELGGTRGSRLPAPGGRRPRRLRPGDVRQPRRPARRLRSELRRA